MLTTCRGGGQLDADLRTARPARLRAEARVQRRRTLGEPLEDDAAALGRAIVGKRERGATVLAPVYGYLDAGRRSPPDRLVDRLAHDLVEADLGVLAELVAQIGVDRDLELVAS